MEAQFQRRPWLVPLVLAILTLIFLGPVVFAPSGSALTSDDLMKEFYPLHGFIRQSLQAGALPLWNPHIFIGHPIAGNAQAALFYPASWFIWLVGVKAGIGLSMVFHTWLGGWGMARLMRSFGSTHTGSLLAGVVYAMSGWAAARYFAGHYSIITSAAWLPWILLAYQFALRRRRWWSLLPGMAALGLAILSGSPPILVYIGLSLVILWGYHILNQASEMGTPLPRACWDAGWRLAAILVGGAILGAVVLLPTAELTRLSVRNDTDLVFADKFALPAAQLLTLALPRLFGEPNATPQPYWGADFYQELSAYAGLLPLICIALSFRARRRNQWLFLVFAVLGCLLALGLHGGLLPILVRWVPGFSLFRAAGRSLFFTVLGLSGLTALVVTTLQEADVDARRTTLRPALRTWLPLTIAAVVIGSVFFSGWFASASHVEPMPYRAVIVASTLAEAGLILALIWVITWLWADKGIESARWALWLTCLLVILDAWHVGLPLITVGTVPDPPIWAGASTNIPPGPDARVVAPLGYENLAMVTGLLNVSGYDPLPIDSYDKLQKMSDAANPTTAINTLLGVKYLLATEPYDKPNFELIGISGGRFYRRTDPFPRAWLAHTLTIEPNDDATRQQIASGKLDLLNKVFVDHPITCETNGGTAQITDYQNDRVQLEASGGLLVLSDQFYPGWQASIDGIPAEIVRADTVFRAVCVPPGNHIVRFGYKPLSFYVGFALSAAGWLCWLAACGVAFLKRNRDRVSEDTAGTLDSSS